MSGFEAPRGPRVRRWLAQTERDWQALPEARRQLAAEYRTAGEALLRAADAYEHGTMRDVATAVTPAIGILRGIVTAIALGQAVRREMDSRDLGEN